MNAAFVCDERDRQQNKRHDQDHALFVFGEFEDSKQAVHRSVAQLSLFNSGTAVSSLGFLQDVILSEAKNLRSFLCMRSPNQWSEMFRFAQHDKIMHFIFLRNGSGPLFRLGESL